MNPPKKNNQYLKLLYLLPILLLGLSLTPVTLYKDKVEFLLVKNPNAQFDDLAGAVTALDPGHWKMIDYSVNASANFDDISFSFSDTETVEQDYQEPEVPKPEPLYQGATFRGFPFAAYFSKDSSTKTANSSSSERASGFSWLWIAIDTLLVIVSLIVAFIVNRKKRQPIAISQPFVPQTSVSSGISSTPPQANTIQPTVFSSNQPTQISQPQSQIPQQPASPTSPETPTQPGEDKDNL